MKATKRIIALLLVAFMVVGMLPTTAWAETVEQIHNFTDSGKTSDFYKITGNLATNKGSVTYNNLTLTQCLKMESSTNIVFTAPSDGTLTLVFGGSTSASGKSVKIDGTKVTCDTDSIYSGDINAGEHTITKGDSINLFYMVYVPAATDCTHSNTTVLTAVAATCTDTGKTEGLQCADCGTILTTQTTVAALGHNFVDGICTRCSESDPTYFVPGNATYTFDATTDVDSASDVANLSSLAGGMIYVSGDGVTVKSGQYIQLSKNKADALVFTVTGSANVTVVAASTGSSNTSLVGIIDADGKAVAEDSGATSVTGTSGTALTYTGLSAGTYKIVCNDTSRGVRIISVSIDHTTKSTGGEEHVHSYTAAVTTAATCIAEGVKTYTCTCGESYTEAIPVTDHDYVDGVCSVCEAEDPDYNPTEPTVTPSEPSEPVEASVEIHNFTENGTTSTFYTISGNLNTKKGTVIYNGLTLTQCLKMESKTEIGFNALEAGQLTLVFGNEVDAAAGQAVTIDGADQTVGDDSTLTVNVAAGSHTITKGDTMNLFYMVYIPASHTHSYEDKVTAPTCTEQGYTTHTCVCGNSSVDTYVDALGHAWDSGVHTEGTFESNGYTTYTCQNDASHTDIVYDDPSTQLVAVAAIGDNKYESLQEAIDAAEAGATVTLLSDITISGETIKVAADDEIILDLAGYDITGTDTKESGNYDLIYNEGILTIKDSVGEGKITLTATTDRDWNAYSAVISNHCATLIVEGGTIEHLGGTDMAYAIDNRTNTGTKNATLTVTNGNIASTYRAIRQFANSTVANNTVSITGGTVTGGNRAVFLQNANAKTNPAALTITEEASVGSVYVYAVSDASAITVSIDADALVEGAEVVSALPEGYELPSVDGVYGIVVKNYVAEVAGTKYETLAGAIDAAKAGDSITLVNNVTLTADCADHFVVDGKTVTIDLNGYTVTGSGCDGVFQAINGANLTLTDSSENKTGTVVALKCTHSYAMTVWAKGATVNIAGGTYTQGEGDYTDDTYNLIYASAGATVNITGGKFAGKETSLTLNLKDSDRETTKIVVSGGEFVGFNPSCNAAEGQHTNFAAEGLIGQETNGVYTLVEGTNVVVDAAVAPTCTETGLTEGSHCGVCGKVLVAQETVDALGHSEAVAVEENRVDATCTEDGSYDAVIYCSVCNEELSRVSNTIAATGHNFVDGTCTNCGETEVVDDDFSGTYYIGVNLSNDTSWYMSSNLTTGSTKRYAAISVDALPTQIYDNVAEAYLTFTLIKQEDGTYLISSNGKYLDYTSGNSGALADTAEDALRITVVKNEDGTYALSNGTRYLSRNNDAKNEYFAWYTGTQTDDLHLIPVVKGEDEHVHSYTAVVTAPTCTEQGYTTYTCAECGDSYVDDYVDALGHNYVDGVCDVCGDVDPNYVDYSGTYYIGVALSGGTSWYMSSEANGTRYSAIKTDALAEKITANAVDAQTFTLTKQEDGTYLISSNGKYLTHTSGNTGSVTDSADSAVKATVEKNDDGTYLISYQASDAVRYISRNSTATNKYFAWYKSGQIKDLHLIPVEESYYEIPSVSVSVGNTLGMYFWIPEANIADGDYAKVVKNYVDRDAVEVTVSKSEWLHIGGYWVVPFDGIAAKEMMDDVTCTIYNAAGEQVSVPGTSSVRKYVDSQLDVTTTTDALKTVMIDMLNYGAEAQKQFGYDTGNLANADLDPADAAFATATIDMNALGHHAVKGDGMYGGALTLKSSILMNVFFESSKVTHEMTAKVTYTNYKNEPVSYEISGDKFVEFGATYVAVNVETLVAADLASIVKIEIYDGDTFVTSGEYNMAYYCMSTADTAISVALAKYCTSACTYLNSIA